MSLSPLTRISILAVDGVFASTLMQAKEFFHIASLRHGRNLGLGLTPALQIRLVSPDGQPVTSFSGVRILVDEGLDAAEVILLPAFWGDFDQLRARHPHTLEWLRERHAAGAILCGEATGVFWMAASGLLDGKPATTYWRFHDEFASRFPRVLLLRDRHQSDSERLYCASGATSASDLYIHLIERICGTSVAQGVARDLFYEIQRSYTPGRLGFGGQKLHQDPNVLQIQQWLEEHFCDKFRFEDVAREHGMSIRNFMRRFHAATGDKPLHYLQRLRVETAKNLLSATRKSIKTISYEVGYDDASFFARLFRQHTGLSPNQYRRQLQRKEPAATTALRDGAGARETRATAFPAGG